MLYTIVNPNCLGDGPPEFLKLETEIRQLGLLAISHWLGRFDLQATGDRYREFVICNRIEG